MSFWFWAEEILLEANLNLWSCVTCWCWSQIALLNHFICEATVTQDFGRKKKPLKKGKKNCTKPHSETQRCRKPQVFTSPSHVEVAHSFTPCLCVADPGHALGQVAGTLGGHQSSWPWGSCQPGDIRDLTQAQTVPTAVTAKREPGMITGKKSISFSQGTSVRSLPRRDFLGSILASPSKTNISIIASKSLNSGKSNVFTPGKS